MRNRLLEYCTVISLFAACNVYNSDAAMAVNNTSPLEINPAITNTNTIQIKQKSPGKYYIPASSKPSAQIKNTTDKKTKNYTKKNTTVNSPANNASVSASNKDLKIEASVEKTQKEAFFTDQSPAELQEIVSRIGRKILNSNNITNSVQFTYDKSETVNANTNLNNNVKVYKGLIQKCEDDDELAYVIGHELGHATSYHVAQSIVTKTAGSCAASIASSAVATALGNPLLALGAGKAISAATGLGEKKISRIHENNADLLSIDYIVKAGYNPLASISIIYKIGTNYPDFFSDHTSTDRRIVLMYNYIKQKYPQYLETGYDTKAYNQALEDYIYRK